MGAFKKIQGEIAKKEGISKDRAGAILASGARKASKKAKAHNPGLCHVAGACGHARKPNLTHKLTGKHYA